MIEFPCFINISFWFVVLALYFYLMFLNVTEVPQCYKCYKSYFQVKPSIYKGFNRKCYMLQKFPKGNTSL